MDLVTCKYAGRMGNNLFQIACAFNYSKMHSKQLVLNENEITKYFPGLEQYLQTNHDLVDFKNYNDGVCFSEIPFIDGNVRLVGFFQSDNIARYIPSQMEENDSKVNIDLPLLNKQ